MVSLAALFAAELILISVWLDGESLSLQVPLVAAIRVAGALTLRGVVGFSVVFITFAFLKYGVVPGAAGGHQTPGEVKIRWSLLCAHFLAMAAFGTLSFLLYSRNLAASASNAVALGWLAAGLSAIALAALAFVPGSEWLRSLRTTGSLWILALLVAVVVAGAGDGARLAWVPLSRLTFHLVRSLLALFVSNVVTDPAQALIGTARFTVAITPACSGFEGMALILAFGVVWLILFRNECRFPQALLLLPAGVAFIYLLNAIRITALILIGDAGAPQIAAGGFHSQAGWIAFAAASLAFSFAARRVPWIFAHGTVETEESAPADPTAAYLIPFLAILAAGMVSAALSAGFEWLNSLRFFAAAACLWIYRDTYRTLDWRFSWRGPAAGGILFFVWIAMDRWSGGPSSAFMPPDLAGAPVGLRMGWIGLRALAAVATVPIAEELAFRGYLLRRLAAPDFESVPWRAVSLAALVGSSVLFGLMHGQRWPGGIAAGLLFGWLAMRRGQIGEAVAAHAVTNAILAIYVLAWGQWQLW